MTRCRDRIRAIDRASTEEIALVATRMRQTLVEVLGEERGVRLYTLEWLDERVRWHLDPNAATGEIFLAETEQHDIVGHTIVRVEKDDDGTRFGLFSTTFVATEFRRHGIATSLRLRGEAWMIERGLTSAVTDTAQSNGRLIALFGRAGYAPVAWTTEMVRLAKPLPRA